MKRDEVKQLIDRGLRELNEALAAGRSDRLKQYLDVMARFPRYSLNNCILIAIQRPDATMVQGFHAWKKLGRCVTKGEKGIGIIAPMVGRKQDEAGSEDISIFGFKVVHVFDVSQTEGDALPEFVKVKGDPGRNIVAIEAYIQSEGIELCYEMIPSGANGVSKNGKIIIDPELEPASRLQVLVHELAHENLHWNTERRNETSKTVRETEAEAVASVVCQALGLDTIEHCADYIQLYNGDAEVLIKSMDYIQKTATKILEGINAHTSTDATSQELAA